MLQTLRPTPSQPGAGNADTPPSSGSGWVTPRPGRAERSPGTSGQGLFQLTSASSETKRQQDPTTQGEGRAGGSPLRGGRVWGCKSWSATPAHGVLPPPPSQSLPSRAFHSPHSTCERRGQGDPPGHYSRAMCPQQGAPKSADPQRAGGAGRRVERQGARQLPVSKRAQLFIGTPGAPEGRPVG